MEVMNANGGEGNGSGDEVKSFDVPLPSPFTLRFDTAELERRFQNYFYIKKIHFVRVTLPCLLLAFALLGFYDVFGNDNGTWEKLVILRYTIQCPLLLIFLRITFTDSYRLHNQGYNTVIALIIGATNITQSMLGQEPDHGPQMLYFFVVYMFFQLRFLYATFVCWTLHCAFIIFVRILVPSYSGRLPLSFIYMTLANFALMFAAYFNEYWIRLDFARQMTILAEEGRANDLLTALLPDRVTYLLKNLPPTDSLIAEEFQNVSILFSDIVGFTAYSASITAKEVVNFLNALYTTFDHLTVYHNVLKIETIGDAYFVASGVEESAANVIAHVNGEDGAQSDPTKSEEMACFYAANLARLAFDMDFVLSQFKLKDNFTLRVRIGMHVGRVVAGVVGLKVPRYHLFGETVTIASLMESTGEPSKIQISQQMYDKLKNFENEFRFERRRDEDREGKRKNFTTYFLHSVDDNKDITGYFDPVEEENQQSSSPQQFPYPSASMPQRQLLQQAENADVSSADIRQSQSHVPSHLPQLQLQLSSSTLYNGQLMHSADMLREHDTAVEHGHAGSQPVTDRRVDPLLDHGQIELQENRLFGTALHLTSSAANSSQNSPSPTASLSPVVGGGVPPLESYSSSSSIATNSSIHSSPMPMPRSTFVPGAVSSPSRSSFIASSASSTPTGGIHPNATMAAAAASVSGVMSTPASLASSPKKMSDKGRVRDRRKDMEKDEKDRHKDKDKKDKRHKRKSKSKRTKKGPVRIHERNSFLKIDGKSSSQVEDEPNTNPRPGNNANAGSVNNEASKPPESSPK